MNQKLKTIHMYLDIFVLLICLNINLISLIILFIIIIRDVINTVF